MTTTNSTTRIPHRLLRLCMLVCFSVCMYGRVADYICYWLFSVVISVRVPESGVRSHLL